eukprot:2269569-Pleurochrysis_carterae.AAC.2
MLCGAWPSVVLHTVTPACLHAPRKGQDSDELLRAQSFIWYSDCAYAMRWQPFISKRTSAAPRKQRRHVGA